MIRNIILLLQLLLSCHSPAGLPPGDAAAAFASFRVEGTCILYELETDSYSGYRPDRWDSAYVPASTFKIMNSLVSLETRVIADEHTVIPWDSVTRSIPAWNRDHTLASAFRVSAVWFYQELARRIGPDRMQRYLEAASYGNRTMGGKIDEFWLKGGLRISPRQQIEFLVRLYRGTLPFSPATMATVREVMIQERTGGYALRAKTGWSDLESPGVGWYVGYVEREGRTVFFATELDIREERDLSARIEVTRAVLKQAGLID